MVALQKEEEKAKNGMEVIKNAKKRGRGKKKTNKKLIKIGSVGGH